MCLPEFFVKEFLANLLIVYKFKIHKHVVNLEPT
jgi:hypothetical protein